MPVIAANESLCSVRDGSYKQEWTVDNFLPDNEARGTSPQNIFQRQSASKFRASGHSLPDLVSE